jgi:hypothetical protein
VLPFAESFLAIVAALVIPTLVGLFIVAGVAKSVSQRYLAAFTLGIYFWFFSDTIGDSSYLDVNSGFSGGAVQVALVILFAVGLVLVFSLDRTIFKPGPAVAGLGFAVPVLVAFAVGFHGFGEGAAFSATAAATPSTNLLDAFGGLSAAVAFILHKALEPMMIGAVYWTYAKDRAKNAASVVRDMLLLAAVFTIPGIVGGATDYFLNYDTTYFFAFGLGTSIYAAVRLAKPLFLGQNVSNSESIKVALLMLFGFLSIYFAALFHS